MSKTNSITIEVADKCVKMVQAKASRGQGQVTSSYVHRLSSDTQEELAKAFQEVAKQRNVHSSGAYLVLPRHLAILKVLKLPSQDEREIRQMMEIQISNQTPYGLDEVDYEFSLLNRDAEGYTHVLLIVIPKSVSNRYIELANSVGISLSGLTISSAGILGWYRYQVERNRLSDESAIAVCNIDVNHSEICFFDKQKLVFSRNINNGLAELREDAAQMIHQIGLSLNYYHSEKMGGPISKLVVVSDQRDVQGFIGDLEHQIQMPCDLISATEGVQIPKSMQPDVLVADMGVTMTAAMGIQFLDPKYLINLLPQSIRVSKVSKVRQKELAKLFVLGAAIYGLILFNWSRAVVVQEGEVQQLRTAISELNPQIDGAKGKVKLIEFFDSEVKCRIFVPEIMRRLAALVPDQISLRALYLNEGRVLTIQGYAQTREALNNFQTNLVNEDIFKNCNLEFATSRKIFNMQVTDFKFICELAECEE